MSVVALSPIEHNKVLYQKGDTITDITADEAQVLVDSDVALPVNGGNQAAPVAAEEPTPEAAPVEAAPAEEVPAEVPAEEPTDEAGDQPVSVSVKK